MLHFHFYLYWGKFWRSCQEEISVCGPRTWIFFLIFLLNSTQVQTSPSEEGQVACPGVKLHKGFLVPAGANALAESVNVLHSLQLLKMALILFLLFLLLLCSVSALRSPPTDTAQTGDTCLLLLCFQTKSRQVISALWRQVCAKDLDFMLKWLTLI